VIGRLGAGPLARFSLARGIGLINTTPARLTQVAVETLGHLAATQARLTQLAVEVIGPASRERFRVVMI